MAPEESSRKDDYIEFTLKVKAGRRKDWIEFGLKLEPKGSPDFNFRLIFFL